MGGLRVQNVISRSFCLSGALGLALGGCASPGKVARSTDAAFRPPDVTPLADTDDPSSLEAIEFQPLELGETWKSRIDKDDPEILVDGYRSRFQAFELPLDRPVVIRVETATSFEVPHYPVKYLFCPRILLLDARFNVVRSSVFEDLEQKQRIFGEPRFVYEETLWPDDSDVRYLLLVRESAFDGRYVTSMYRDESAPETSFYGRRRERIYASGTGPLRVQVERFER